MKRHVPVGLVRVRVRPFPGRIAGASLKRVDAVEVVPDRADFPRQNRRGLIEAKAASIPVRSELQSFPGRIAGASLKRLDRRMIRVEEVLLSPAESPGPH